MTDPYKDRNRQARRSIKALQQALLELLEEKPYQKITITEISDRSGLTRSTFYAHFDTKEDLLVSYVDNILDQFFANLAQRDILNPDIEQDVGINISLFEIWKESSEINEIINTTDIEAMIIKRFRQYWDKNFEARVAEARPEISPALAAYLNSFLAYAVFGIIKEWIVSGMTQSTEDMGHMLYTLTGPPAFRNMLDQFKHKI